METKWSSLIREVAVEAAMHTDEQSLIETAIGAVSACGWIVGEAAAEWTQQYAQGRTDDDFAQAVGSTRKTINTQRRVFERFGKTRCGHNGQLKHTHFAVALPWDDAEECLEWAASQDPAATVQQMTAWRRARNGENLLGPPAEAIDDHDDDETDDVIKIKTRAREPESPICRPKRKAKSDSANGKTKQHTGTVTEFVLRHCDNEKAKAATARELWKVLQKIDPLTTRKTRPTIAAMLALIPAEWDSVRTEAATQWAQFKVDLTGKAKIQNMGQWQTVLKQMSQYDATAVLDTVEESISNGWIGWKHKLDNNSVSPRVRSTNNTEVIYRDFD